MQKLILPLVLVVVVGLFIAVRSGGGVAPKPPVFAALALPEAEAAAAKDDRLVVVKVSAEWCGPCQAMNRETFVDAKVVDWLKAHAVAIEVDGDREPGVVRAFKVEAYPTTIVLRSGEEVSRREGYLDAGELLAWLGPLREATPSAPAPAERPSETPVLPSTPAGG